MIFCCFCCLWKKGGQIYSPQKQLRMLHNAVDVTFQQHGPEFQNNHQCYQTCQAKAELDTCSNAFLRHTISNFTHSHIANWRDVWEQRLYFATTYHIFTFWTHQMPRYRTTPPPVWTLRRRCLNRHADSSQQPPSRALLSWHVLCRTSGRFRIRSKLANISSDCCDTCELVAGGGSAAVTPRW